MNVLGKCPVDVKFQLRITFCALNDQESCAFIINQMRIGDKLAAAAIIEICNPKLDNVDDHLKPKYIKNDITRQATARFYFTSKEITYLISR